MTALLLTAAMLVVPAAGGLLTGFLRNHHRVALTATAGLSCIAAGLWIACEYAGIISASTQLTVGNWLAIPTAPGLAVQLSFLADQNNVLLVFVVSLVVLLDSAGSLQSGSSAESLMPLTQIESTHGKEPVQHFYAWHRWLAVLFPLSVATVLADDLVLLVILWILLDCCVFGLQRQSDSLSPPESTPPTTVAVLSVSSVLLLVATLMATSRFGTTSIPEIISESALDGRVDATAVVSGLTIVFAAAIAARCGLFPAIMRVRGCVNRRHIDAGRTVTLAWVLPGIALAVAVLPLADLSLEGCLLTGTLGALTCVTAIGIALVQKRADDISTLLIVSVGGLALSALASGHADAGGIAVCTVFAQVLAILVLRQSAGESKLRFATTVAMVVTVSGLGGANAVLSVIEDAQHQSAEQAVTAASSPEQFLNLIWWGCVASQILWGIAIVKMISVREFERRPKQKLIVNRQTGRHSDPTATPTEVAEDRTHTALTALAACFALGACLVPFSNSSITGLPTQARLFSFGEATPACLLGVVVAWLLSRASEKARQRMAGASDSLARLCGEWFYLDAFRHRGVAMPAKLLAILIEVSDRRIFGGTSEEGWRQTPSRLADSLEHLRFQPAVYYGLTGLLLISGLLWSLF